MPRVRTAYVTYLERPKEAVDFRFISSDGNERALDELNEDGKETVIIFWSLNCALCVEHIRDYDKLVRAGQNENKANFLLISSDTWEDWSKAYSGGLAGFARERGLTVPLYALAEGEWHRLSQQFENLKTPEYILFNEERKVAKRFVLNESGLEEAFRLITQEIPTESTITEGASVMDLDIPEKVVNFNLIKTQKGVDGFTEVGRLKTMRINNGKPTLIVIWVSTHAPCRDNFEKYEMLYDLSEQLQKVNFILLDYNPDIQGSEKLEHLSKIFADYDLGFPIFTLDTTAPENQHPTRQFQTFLVPELIMIDPDNKVREHFVLADRPSFKKALQLISQS